MLLFACFSPVFYVMAADEVETSHLFIFAAAYIEIWLMSRCAKRPLSIRRKFHNLAVFCLVQVEFVSKVAIENVSLPTYINQIAVECLVAFCHQTKTFFMPIEFSELLGQYMHHADCSVGRLSRLSGIPVRTLENWLNGRVRRPRKWQSIIKAAHSLHLSAADTNRLLETARHSNLEQLSFEVVSVSEQTLLQPWMPQPHTHPPPFQAVSDLPYFVGRESEINTIQRVILQHKSVVIHNLQGMGGIGKTALAAHFAYRLRTHFPDGVLWARVDVSSTMAILNSFAAAYGQDVSQHIDLASRARVVRDILVHKKSLIVLDNVENDEQIRPLLPPNGRCAVILTSRRRNLASTLGMHHIELGLFKDEESLSLFTTILGEDYVQRQQVDLLILAEMVGYLPLAISIIAGQLAYNSEQTAVSLIRHLKKHQQHLDALVYGDLNVRASFNVSYAMLSPDTQQFFAALGIFEGEDFSIEAVAAITELSTAQAQSQLETLHQLSLVQQARPDRFTLHSLLRIFARERIQNDNVYQRFTTFFAKYSVQHKHAYDNLDLELDNLFTALRTAVTHSDRDNLITLVNALCYFLFMRGMYEEIEDFLKLAQQAAEQNEDIIGLAQILDNLGVIAHRRGHYDEARHYFQTALNTIRNASENKLLAQILNDLGGTEHDCGQYEVAYNLWLESLTYIRESGGTRQVVVALTNLGSIPKYLGRYKKAREYWCEALTLAREINETTIEGVLLTNLGTLDINQGNLVRAEQFTKEALQIASTTQRKTSLCKLYDHLAEIAVSRRNYTQAEQYAEKAVQIAREVKEPVILAWTLANYGRTVAGLNDFEKAATILHESLALANSIGYLSGQAMTLRYKGKLESLGGQHEQAELTLKKSLTFAQQLNNVFTLTETWQELGEAYLNYGKYNEAMMAFQKTLALAQKHEFYPHEGMALFGLAQATHHYGEKAKAQAFAEASQAVFDKIEYKFDSHYVQQWLNN